ncbi:Deoxyribose-phosphate aldolase [Merluccius polli]|uniref:deoxyribose-phosphate aldolase n=1 Tax=Merluccius polli TaxID=89951 RepID=A0AA47N1Q2_MERPO|nr:Deoxyribose-phosphate aldolase [Merluccius polli]
MSARNPGMNMDLEWVSKVRVNTQAVLKRAQQIQSVKLAKKQWQAAWLLKAVTCIDLTTLAGDDTPSNVHRLCMKAVQPVPYDLLQSMGMHDKGVTTGAVCVYPSRVADAVKSLKAANSSLPVASVATGFPAGQTLLKTRLEEVRAAVADGAAEIDIVINRTLALTGQWEAMYDEIRQFREACGDAHMKTILAIGELGTFTNVYKASLVSMMAGSDFIKTSTGKESVNATYPVAIVMVRAIRDYFLRTGHKFIRFPLDNQQLHMIKANFMACRYAGVVCAIDGTHIQIIAPSKDEDVFVNRKKVHSINTQIVFDATFNILDVAKWPGSTHDPRILMGSGLRREAPCTSWVSCWVTVAVPARRLDTLSQSTTGSTVKVGFKPAGGIRTAKESLVWLALIKEELGDAWLGPHLFRLGASSLLADIERQIFHYVTGRYPALHELPMA